MPIEETITRYMCETCKAMFNDIELAELCEQKHIHPPTLKFAWIPEGIMPDKIMAYNSDGKLLGTYKRN